MYCVAMSNTQMLNPHETISYHSQQTLPWISIRSIRGCPTKFDLLESVWASSKAIMSSNGKLNIVMHSFLRRGEYKPSMNSCTFASRPQTVLLDNPHGALYRKSSSYWGNRLMNSLLGAISWKDGPKYIPRTNSVSVLAHRDWARPE